MHPTCMIFPVSLVYKLVTVHFERLTVGVWHRTPDIGEPCCGMRLSDPVMSEDLLHALDCLVVLSYCSLEIGLTTEY